MSRRKSSYGCVLYTSFVPLVLLILLIPRHHEKYSATGIDRFCFNQDSRESLYVAETFAETNNKLIVITKGIILAHYLKVGTLYFDEELTHLIGEFDRSAFPCWNIQLYRGQTFTYRIRSAFIFWGGEGYHELQDQLVWEDGSRGELFKHVFDACPTRESLLLSQGFLIPKGDVRNAVRRFRDTKLVGKTVIGILYRALPEKDADKSYFWGRAAYKEEWRPLLRSKAEEIDVHFIWEMLEGMGVHLNGSAVIVTHRPGVNDLHISRLKALPWHVQVPGDWGVLGDMWLQSFADVLFYLPVSTVSRTTVLWSFRNNPQALIWPPLEAYTTNKRENIFCYKHEHCW